MGSDGNVIRVGRVVVVGVPVVVDIHGVRRAATVRGSSPPVATAARYSDHPGISLFLFIPSFYHAVIILVI